MKRFLRSSFVFLRNLSAVLGVVLLGLVAVTYLQGRRVLAEFEPQAIGALSSFGERVLSEDVTSALALRVALPSALVADEAIAAMKQRADERGLPAVHRRVVKSAGDERRESVDFQLEYLDLCDSEMQLDFLKFNKDFGAHAPCRIALLKDNVGRAWLMALDLDPLIGVHRKDDPARKARLFAFKDALLDVLNAGASTGQPASELDRSIGQAKP